MSISVSAVAPAAALGVLADTVAALKATDALTPVTVVVPTNTSGVMARRALGASGGVVGVDMVTLNRLAELIAGPGLAAERRRPSSNPVIDLTVRKVLDTEPGMYAPVATHPSTTVALRDLHAELRLAGPRAAGGLVATRRGREVARISAAVTRALSPRWYDEADLFERATHLVDELGGRLAQLVVYLPAELSALATDFLVALGTVAEVRVIVSATGNEVADHDTVALARSLTGGLFGPADRTAPGTAVPRRIVSTTDADDEVRVAVRAVVDAARGGADGSAMPFHRIAVLWPTHRPYARLVEHHLDAAGVPWNGPSGTGTAERIVPRFVLDLLDVDRRGLRRRDLFDLLADVPVRTSDGAPRPTAEWERVGRYAGLHREDDWAPRLDSLRDHPRWGSAATELADFVGDLRRTLGHPSQTRSWWDWASWCDAQVDSWLGRTAVQRLAEPEYRAYEALTVALERLRHLDSVGEPVTRHRFRTVLEAELDAMSSRQGRVGDGVTVGSLATAAGLDVDVVVVLGGAEGVLPTPPANDPLLSDADRARAGLMTADVAARRMLHQLLATVSRTRATITIPRGDLRASVHHEPSRWLDEWIASVPIDSVPSHVAGLRSSSFPSSPLEQRLRRRLRAAALVLEPELDADLTLGRALDMVTAHAADELTVYDGNLSGEGLAPLSGPVSPTQIEAWIACPHAYFMRYLLGVRPVEERGGDISINPLERGSVQHEVLDRFHRDVIAGRLDPPGADGWGAAHQRALLAHFDDVCAASERRGRTGRPASWADERRRMQEDLIGWLHHDGTLLVARRATIVASEHDFRTPTQSGTIALPLNDGRSLDVVGVIDRVDRCDDGRLVVTDHKTGGAGTFRKLSADDPTLGCTAFQLPTYAAAARMLCEQPDAVVHAEYGMLQRGSYGRHGITFTPDVWNRVVDDLTHVVNGIEAGRFPARPERPGFQLFIGCHYCQPDGLGTHDSFDRWQRKHRDPSLAPWFGTDEAPI